MNTLHKMVRPEEILQRLFQLTVAMSEAMEEDLARRRLTRARATLLAHLHDQGPTIQSALARALRVSPRNITGLVNGLEASGLVKRSPHPTDGRAALVELTDDGGRAAAALARDEREFAQYLFADRAAGRPGQPRGWARPTARVPERPCLRDPAAVSAAPLATDNQDRPAH